MQFQVPQFIERETRIAGPLTFKQFLYLGGAGLSVFILYFYLAAQNFLLFLVLTVLLMFGALAFAFVNISGIPFSTVLMNFFNFSTSARIFLWKKKEISPVLIRTAREEKKTTEPTPTLKIAEKSQLKKLSTQIEVGVRR